MYYGLEHIQAPIGGERTFGGRPFGYRRPYNRRPFYGRPFGYGFSPFLGGVLGGLVGSALLNPYAYPYPPYYGYPYYPY